MESFLGFLDIVLDLDTLLDNVVNLNVFQRLDEGGDLCSGFVGLLVVETLDLLGHTCKPGRVGLVGVPCAPVAVTSKVLRDFVDVVATGFSILVPYLDPCLN